MTDIGKEVRLTATSPSETNSPASSSELRKWVAGEYQMLREMIPGSLPSKEADALALDMLEAMALEVGVGRFHEMIVRAIETCERRPTIAGLRKLAGLSDRLDVHANALAQAWELITLIVTRHTGMDGEGNVILQSHIYRNGEVFREDVVPEIPEDIRRTVRTMGGWTALVESHPKFWGMRFQQFKELYRSASTVSLAKNQS